MKNDNRQVDELAKNYIKYQILDLLLGNNPIYEFSVIGIMIQLRKIRKMGHDWKQVCRIELQEDEITALEQLVGDSDYRNIFVLRVVAYLSGQDSATTANTLFFLHLPKICLQAYGLNPKLILYHPNVDIVKKDPLLDVKLHPLLLSGYRYLPGTDYYYWIAKEF